MTEMMAYHNLDLIMERSESGYRARMLDLSDPSLETAQIEFASTLEDLDLDDLLTRLGLPNRGTVLRDTRRTQPPETDRAEALEDCGRRLFEAVFHGEALSHLHQRLEQAREDDVGLRIRLRFTGAPELAQLPWEYLYDPTHGDGEFITFYAETPLVRYPEVPQRIRPCEFDAPLNILVVISSPEDEVQLDAAREWQALKDALKGLEDSGLIQVDMLGQATVSALQQKLRQGKYHILHFIGHGDFDPGLGEGIIIMEREDGRAFPMSTRDLGIILHDEVRTLRLVVLNACKGARAVPEDPCAGLAQGLIQEGLPAVIAMQFAITDEAAITFAQEFYRALADGYPIDAAVAEARRAIYLKPNRVEWGIPVLFMLSEDGQIFRAKRARLPIHKRRIRIGRVSIPTILLPLAALLVVLASALLGWSILGPGKMSSVFNIAVADFGEVGKDGKVHASDYGQQFSKWLVEGLKNETTGLPSQLKAQVRRVGREGGASSQERARTAARLAENINAHLVIYGNLTEDGASLKPEFYVAGLSEAEEIVGSHELGAPISLQRQTDFVENQRLVGRARALVLFTTGLAWESAGDPEEALDYFLQAKEVKGWMDDEGKEVLDLFIGREHLLIAQKLEAEGRDEGALAELMQAREAFERALTLDPDYARAHLGLAGVYFEEAEQVPPEQRFGQENVCQAIQEFQLALVKSREGAVTAPASTLIPGWCEVGSLEFEQAPNEASRVAEVAVESKAHLGLASVFLLMAESYRDQDEYAIMASVSDSAIEEVQRAFALVDEDEHRHRAQGYVLLGVAAENKAWIRYGQGDRLEAEALWQDAVEAYGQCVAHADDEPGDWYLQDLKKEHCLPNQDRLQKYLGILRGE